MKMKILISILIIIFSLMVTGCYASMTGTVVDAETGKPVEGAVVLVEWTIEKGLPGLGHTESYKVVEVVTDREGKFEVSGVLNPLVDPSHVTVYKKGYVAWNNEYIFPDYKKREDFKWQKGYIFKLEQFKEGYSYNQHISFIRTCMRSTLSSEKKKKFEKSFDWEVDLARKEVKRK